MKRRSKAGGKSAKAHVLTAVSRLLTQPVGRCSEVEIAEFPPPWTTEETDGCFIVKDRNGQKLAYADERPHTYSPATRHGARIAVNVAKLSESLSRSARISGA